MIRLVRIQFADGKIRTFDMESLTINDMNNIYAVGGVVIGYINE